MSRSRPAASASAVRWRSSGDGVGSPLGWLWTMITLEAVSRTASRNSSPTRTSEALLVFALNTKNLVIGMEVVYRGNVSASLVRVGELFRFAIRVNASAIIIVHNHPSGDASPSGDDLHLTAEALAAGRLLDVQVLDHIVVAGYEYRSLRESGVTFDRPNGGRPA